MAWQFVFGFNQESSLEIICHILAHLKRFASPISSRRHSIPELVSRRSSFVHPLDNYLPFTDPLLISDSWMVSAWLDMVRLWITEPAQGNGNIPLHPVVSAIFLVSMYSTFITAALHCTIFNRCSWSQRGFLKPTRTFPGTTTV